MASRKRAQVGKRQSPREGGSLCSAQDLADFCEVDLKTVHNWADRDKIRHFRTEGRHLRFRPNDIVRFLRRHGYPLPDALRRMRPTIAVGLGAPLDGSGLEHLLKRLASRCAIRCHRSGASAVAHLIAESVDAVVLHQEDSTLRLPALVRALKDDPATAFVLFALIVTEGDESLHAAQLAGADIVLPACDLARLPTELGKALGIATPAARTRRTPEG